jgi:ribosomal protein S18 acetylase RimI-like enzyme
MARTPIQDSDREELAVFVEERWGAPFVMSRGKAFYPHREEGFIERLDGCIAGLLTFHIDAEGMEVLTLDSTLEGEGIGSALMLSAIDEARSRGCHRVWLTTTNDNLKGLRFYQRLGFRIVQINLGAVDAARKIKPQIPTVGQDGIEIHDELVLELAIQPFIEGE